MLSYKLSLPVRSGGHNDSRFFYILYWLEEKDWLEEKEKTLLTTVGGNDQ
jgi:hypothetical protein